MSVHILELGVEDSLSANKSNFFFHGKSFYSKQILLRSLVQTFFFVKKFIKLYFFKTGIFSYPLSVSSAIILLFYFSTPS